MIHLETDGIWLCEKNAQRVWICNGRKLRISQRFFDGILYREREKGETIYTRIPFRVLKGGA